MKEYYIILDESGAMHDVNSNHFVIGGYLIYKANVIRHKHIAYEKTIKNYAKYLEVNELKGSNMEPHHIAESIKNGFSLKTFIPFGIIVCKQCI